MEECGICGEEFESVVIHQSKAHPDEFTRPQAKSFIRKNNIGAGDEGQIGMIEYHFEPWNYQCFSSDQKDYCGNKADSNRAFKEEARIESRKIMEDENWDGFYYFHPDEFRAGTYGGTLFYNIS